MTNDAPKQARPLAIQISGKSNNIRFGSLHVEGDSDLVKIEDDVSDVEFGAIRHTRPGSSAPQPKHWWERPFGMIALGLLVAVAAAGIAFYAGWT